MKVRSGLIIWVIVAAIAGFYSPSSTGHTMAQVEAELVDSDPHVELTDEQAPNFSLRDLEGRTVKLSDFRGKAVVLNFVAAGCRHTCRSQSRIIAKVQALQAEGQGLRDEMQFVSVATSAVDLAETHVVMRERGLDPSNWILLSGGMGQENRGWELAKAYGLEAAPTGTGLQVAEVVMYVIDPKSRLRARFHGLDIKPSRLMLYAAALAHGAHAPVASEAAQRGDLDYRLLFGAVSSGVGMLVFVAWMVWSRRSRLRAGKLEQCESEETQ